MTATQHDSQWQVLLSAAQTGGRVAVIEADLPHGTVSPRHMHSREDELIYVLEGHVTFELNGQRIDGPSGSSLFLPRGSEHTVIVRSSRARLLLLLSPAGLEDSLSELSLSERHATMPQIAERLVTTAARYGVSITGPGPDVAPDRTSVRKESEHHV